MFTKAGAIGIFHIIREAINLTFVDTERPEVEEKVVDYGGDSASVNTGKSNGVVAKIRGGDL